MKRFLLFVLLISLGSATLSGQSRRYKSQVNWLDNLQIVTGVGMMNFLGDLGGANDIGRSFLADWEWEALRPNFQIGARYQWHRWVGTKVFLNYGWITGDDAWTQDDARNDRNLSFRSHVMDWGLQAEFYFLPDLPQKGRYRRRGVRGRGGRPVLGYVFTGINGFWFDPTAVAPSNGISYSLQPLGTEGQFVLPTRDPYSRVQVALPLGVGFAFRITDDINLNVELSYRRSFTDYMDDVSSTYVNPALFEDPIAAELSYYTQAYYTDPEFPGEIPTFGVGQQRGNPQDNDVYMYLQFNLCWNLGAFNGSKPKYPR